MGSNIRTCLANGQWNDQSNVSCRGKSSYKLDAMHVHVLYWSSLCLAVCQFVQLHDMMDWLASCMTCKLAYSRFISCCFVDWLGGEVVG